MSIESDVRKFREFIAKAFDYEKVMKDNCITQDDIDNFREMLKSCEHVPKAMMNKALLTVLVRCDNDYDKAVNNMQNFCKLNREAPEFFCNRNVESAEVQQALDNQVYLTLPPTPDNYNWIVHKLISHEPKDYIFDNAEKAFLITVETCIYRNGPKDGVVFLFDMDGGKVGHLFQPSIRSLRKLMRLVEDGCPFKIQAIHVLNMVPFLNMVLRLLSPLFRTDFMNRVHFYPTDIDYEKFYAEVIPKSCLPSDYGGDLQSIDEMHNKHRKSLLEMRDYFLLEERMMNFEFEEHDFDIDDENFDTKM